MGLTATIQSAVDSMFDAFGDLIGPLRLRRSPSATYDPTQGKLVGPLIDYGCIGAITGVEDSAFPNTLVEVGDRVAYVKDLEITPLIGDKVLDVADIEYTVIDKVEYSSFGTVFAYQLLIRS